MPRHVVPVEGGPPAGVRIAALTMHRDTRGSFTEIYRREWPTGVDPVQWNVVRSAAGVLRGVHVHPRHTDYLLIVEGRAVVGLRDLRDPSPTAGRAVTVEVSGDDLNAITIPPGVAHGFLFLTPAMHVYAVSHYWDLEDELACHWADPDLGLAWPVAPSAVSVRDAGAGPLAALVSELAAYQPIALPDP